MNRLLDVMRRLRAPDGCPWDREQTHESLRPYLLEEAAEAVDALGGEDPLAVADELGDVLLQVAFHAVIAEEAGEYRYETIESAIVDKLVRRHPHVFGAVQAPDSATVVANWNEVKKQERAGRPEPHPAERVPRALGALARAAAVAEATGEKPLDCGEVGQVLDLAPDGADGVADVLEAVVAWARSQGVDPELALRDRAGRRVREAASAGSA